MQKRGGRIVKRGWEAKPRAAVGRSADEKGAAARKTAIVRREQQQEARIPHRNRISTSVTHTVPARPANGQQTTADRAGHEVATFTTITILYPSSQRLVRV